ncbi:hypothetical protein DERF_011012 [Dermatophagoides farinae]|uniref:Uncharacterized protein n=1 Tax=Dermatophagoides farinae TaxID=6954 RepID=A0A922HUK1_DERFA|nr:hypothetical protein DERF_011012 [Dermatophagoides farinae]
MRKNIQTNNGTFPVHTIERSFSAIRSVKYDTNRSGCRFGTENSGRTSLSSSESNVKIVRDFFNQHPTNVEKYTELSAMEATFCSAIVSGRL